MYAVGQVNNYVYVRQPTQVDILDASDNSHQMRQYPDKVTNNRWYYIRSDKISKSYGKRDVTHSSHASVFYHQLSLLQ